MTLQKPFTRDLFSLHERISLGTLGGTQINSPKLLIVYSSKTGEKFTAHKSAGEQEPTNSFQGLSIFTGLFLAAKNRHFLFSG